VALTDHRELASRYFNATWDLIDSPERSAQQDRDMVGLAFASRQHWIEAGGTAENLAIADWQVAHAASHAGLPDLALLFAAAAVERATNDLPDWLRASAHEGLARAYAVAGDRDGYEREAAITRALLETVDNAENRDLIADQLASIRIRGEDSKA
jgi:hypothetical protein